jgi:hypothetical protein
MKKILMKSNSLTAFLYLICLSLLTYQCGDDISKEDDFAELEVLRLDIESLTSTSVCNEEFECKFIAFGSKPCGGPWEYLVYSTSIDTDKLIALVENYNEKENDFNNKWGIISDCSITNPPTNVKCENNMCFAEYKN